MAQVVLITGVSSGFGKYTAEFLANQGFIVYGTSRKKIEVASNINLMMMDVTNVTSIKEGVDTIIAKEGRIDVLINNAGMGITGSIEESSTEEIRLQMDTNFYGMVHTVQAVLPYMRKQANGTIINLSSINGLLATPFVGFYNASKFAIEGMSQTLRMELKQFNIKVILINPGDFYTQFTANRQIIAKAGVNSPYEHQFRKALAVIEKDETGGLPPSLMAHKIYSILQKKNPCSRYVVATFEQKLAVVLKNILPDSWFYKIIADHYKI